MASTNQAPKRLLLLDLVKVFSMISIVIFHFNEFIFDAEYNPLRNETLFFRYSAYFAEFTSFGGQTIVSVVTFLFGFSQPKLSVKKYLKLMVILLIGYVIVGWSYYGGDAFKEFYWDIYPFHIVVFATLILFNYFEKLIPIASIAGAIMLLLPFQKWSTAVGGRNLTREILVGICNSVYKSSWPLLPWIGLAWMFYGIGSWLRRNPQHVARWATLSRAEGVFSCSVIVWCCFCFRTLFGLPYGEGLYCYILQLPHYVTWSYILFIGVLIRLSFVRAVDSTISQQPVLRTLAKSAWAKYLGYSYLLQMILLGLWGNFEKQVTTNPVLFDIALLSIFIMVEWLGITINFMTNRFKPLHT